MKIPGPNHPISITPHPHRIEVRFNGRTIAKTERALAMREASYPIVFYLPREDAEMSLLTRSDSTTHCPYKGDGRHGCCELQTGRRHDVHALELSSDYRRHLRLRQPSHHDPCRSEYRYSQTTSAFGCHWLYCTRRHHPQRQLQRCWSMQRSGLCL